jgi:hypothetical protein
LSKEVVFSRNDLFVGTVPGEDYGYKRNLRVTIDVEISKLTGRTFQTTEHGQITDPLEFSMMLGVWRPNRSDFVACGQYREGLAELTTFAKGFDADKAQRLSELWDRWHLNTMKAACAHQDSTRHSVCQEGSGYVYGHAWLAEELPEGFQAELEALLPPARKKEEA